MGKFVSKLRYVALFYLLSIRGSPKFTASIITTVLEHRFHCPFPVTSSCHIFLLIGQFVMEGKHELSYLTVRAAAEICCTPAMIVYGTFFLS